MQLIAINPALVSVVGDHASVTVLSQIGYWSQGRLRVQWKGQYWLAKSRTEMCAETGITLDQYKRIMPLLVQQGWITTERHLFKNKVTPFIRLTERGTNLLEGKVSKALGEEPTNPCTEITTEIDYVKDGRKERDPEAGEDLEVRRAFGKRKDQEKDQDQEQRNKVDIVSKKILTPQGEPMNAKEILAQHTSPMKGSLGAYWMSRMALLKGTYQHPLTGKEHGQLKQLSKYLGEDVRRVIDYAIHNWWKFASQAGALAGLSSWPAEPHIGYLLKHHAVAMNLLTPQSASPPPVEEAPVQLIATGTETEVAHVLTSKELTELLDSFKSP